MTKRDHRGKRAIAFVLSLFSSLLPKKLMERAIELVMHKPGEGSCEHRSKDASGQDEVDGSHDDIS